MLKFVYTFLYYLQFLIFFSFKLKFEVNLQLQNWSSYLFLLSCFTFISSFTFNNSINNTAIICIFNIWNINIIKVYMVENWVLYLKSTNSGKYNNLLMNLFYQYQLLQKGQFYYNIAFRFYTKTYFLINSFDAFSKNIF